jgi:hypothetical protein
LSAAFLIGFAERLNINAWRDVRDAAFVVSFVFNAICSTVFPAVLFDLFQHKRCWANARVRSIGIAVVGAMWGIHALVCIALTGPSGEQGWLRIFYGNIINRPESTQVINRANELLVQLYVLNVCSFFFNHAIVFAASFALLASVGFSIYDKVKPRWDHTTFAIGTVMGLPAFAAAMVYVYGPRMDLGDLPNVQLAAPSLGEIALIAVCWMCASTIFGMLLTALVGVLRAGHHWFTEPRRVCSGTIE